MKQKIRIYLGLLVSVVFLYFSFKGISFHDVWHNIQGINTYFIMASVVLIIIELKLRAFRWKYLLKPIRGEQVNGLFSVLMIGYFSNNILPARMGELVRAQFLKTNYKVNRMQALATIVVERICDGLMLLGLFAFCLFFYSPFPVWIKRGGVVMGMVFVGALFVLYMYGRNRESIVRVVRSHAKASPLSQRLIRMIENFGIGLAILNDVRNVAIVVPLTIVIWVVEIISINMLLLAFGLKVSVFAAVFVAVMIGLGTSIPSSPGYIGIYEGFGILALMSFGVQKDIALGFSLTLHFLILAITTSIGLVCFMKEFGSIREGAVRLWPVLAK